MNKFIQCENKLAGEKKHKLFLSFIKGLKKQNKNQTNFMQCLLQVNNINLQRGTWEPADFTLGKKNLVCIFKGKKKRTFPILNKPQGHWFSTYEEYLNVPWRLCGCPSAFAWKPTRCTWMHPHTPDTDVTTLPDHVRFTCPQPQNFVLVYPNLIKTITFK